MARFGEARNGVQPDPVIDDRALRAEVRDPLWMLTRQWQMGEFQGDDAGFRSLHR